MRFFLLIYAVLMVVSCSKTVTNTTSLPPPDEPVDDAIVMEYEPEPETPKPPEEHKLTVYFELNSDVLDSFQKSKLNEVVGPVRLVGGCCPLGTDEHNYSLGIRRAMAVVKELGSRGIKTETYKSVGESELVTTDPRKYNINRRCEVYYVK